MGFAQFTIVKGSVKEAFTFKPVANTMVSVEGTEHFTYTDTLGQFEFDWNIGFGEHILNISKEGYLTKTYPILVDEGQTVNIADMTLDIDVTSLDLYTIPLSNQELNEVAGDINTVSGLLASTLDIFQRTAAFQFGPSFYRARGLDSEYGSVLINGIEMNKVYDHRPQWSNWGGLNDVMANQELSWGISPSSYGFGGILRTTNINLTASQIRKGGRLTYSFSNRSYKNRFMTSYASGVLKNNWAFALSMGRRWGNEGFIEGTLYESHSFLASVEKKISNSHRINVVSVYSPNKRGKSSPKTEEVFNLKGIRYNEYWGWQNGKKRNSRMKHIEEPFFILSHYWDVSEKTSLHTNLAYQFGKRGDSRLDYGGSTSIEGLSEDGGANPSPAYYQKLPSYFERNFPDDLGSAYLALKAFKDKGQIDWNRLYEANTNGTNNGHNATYVLYEDRTYDRQFSFNTILNTKINGNILFDASVSFKQLKSENFALVIDLLGADTYLDVDPFSIGIFEGQNDLLNPNRLVTEGDKFKYNFIFYARVFNVFSQVEFKYKNVDFYLAGSVSGTQYLREGLYQNGAFPDNSFGKGEKQNFLGFGAKGGITWKLTGKHLFGFNLAYVQKAPTLRNSYSNPRQNNNVVPNIVEKKLASVDAAYHYRSPNLNAKFTGYYTTIKDDNELAFYFADGVGGDNAIFIQEILQSVNKNYLGLEFGLEVSVNPSFKLHTAASIGQFTYSNNPSLFLTAVPDESAENAGFVDGFNDYGQSYLKNYKLANGPQHAYSFGFEYRDPRYWWFSTTVNYFSDIYIDINPLLRSSNFISDFDGIPFNDYDETLAKELLKQEKFDDYFVLNFAGGKSWRLGNTYLGLFVSINNVLDEIFKTGGFEQGRNANYRQLRDDKALELPLFGSKYWFGQGTTYFLNMNYRF
ncbi:TonB-dependent receptor [Aestuariivivens sediminicola]|uniref:TonB-dependent receptor n=1 Tax=Aestuariivivens sediminicola TaxID=2913560 RepID=UPI001F598F1A|nr:TonB-dependent receptor [Aestuariivivens sediminicola]